MKGGETFLVAGQERDVEREGAVMEEITEATSRSSSVGLTSLFLASVEMEKCHLHSAIGSVPVSIAVRNRATFAARIEPPDCQVNPSVGPLLSFTGLFGCLARGLA